MATLDTVDELLDALDAAARANEKDAFDRVERQLLAQYPGGFVGMPREVYERYLEIDRQWPPMVLPDAGEAGDGPTGSDRRTLSVRLPIELDAWLREIAARSDRGASAVLAEALQLVRGDGELVERLVAALRDGRPHPD